MMVFHLDSPFLFFSDLSIFCFVNDGAIHLHSTSLVNTADLTGMILLKKPVFKFNDLPTFCIVNDGAILLQALFFVSFAIRIGIYDSSWSNWHYGVGG